MLALLGAGLQIGAGLANFASASSAAKAQNEYNANVYALNKSLILRGLKVNSLQIGRERTLDQLSAAAALQRAQRDAVRAGGIAAATASASGLGGRSVQELVQLAANDLAGIEVRSARREALAQQAAKSSLEGLELSAEAELLGAYQPPVPGPDLLTSMFSIGASAVGSWATISALQGGNG